VRTKVGLPNEQQQKFINARLSGLNDKQAMEAASYQKIPVAECIKLALSGIKLGEWSEAAKNYAFRLACERIGGEPLDEDQYETWAMKRGRALEEECRLRYEADIDIAVLPGGFIRTKDKKFGCSADAIVEPNGSEFKAFYDPAKVKKIVLDGDWGDISDQVQGCIWLTGAEWWDQCLYMPALASVGKDFTRRRVQRDDNYIEKLEMDLVEFERLVSQWEATLRGEI